MNEVSANEIVFPRYVSVRRYAKETGTSYTTIVHALNKGGLRGIRTTEGKWKVDVSAQPSVNPAAIDAIDRKLDKLLAHFGVPSAK